MIGTTLSGVTFISIPGEVGNTHWTYLTLVFGNCVGYIVIALVLLPLFYRQNLVSVDGFFLFYRVAAGGRFLPVILGRWRVATGFL